LLLSRHRSLILVSLGALAGCGDNACPGPSTDSTCRLTRIDGPTPAGELGFRFGAPLDLDGDGLLDLAAGARYGGPGGGGEAGVWTLDGEPLAHWEGTYGSSLFGQVTVPVPDLDGDGRADVVVAAPLAQVEGGAFGAIAAYSVRDGHLIWRATTEAKDGLGWHVERAGDHDGDGIEDLWAGATSNPDRGRAYLLSGRDGSVLRTITSTRSADRFGFYVVPMGDLDGDGERDVAIGAPGASINGRIVGAVTLASAATGAPLRELAGDLPGHLFGEMLAPLDDLDGDGLDDLAIAAPVDAEQGAAPGSSEVHIVSSGTGARLRLLAAREPGELYGRMLATVDDLDGDGLRDLAIGAPWWNERRGRIEVRSSRTNAVLAELYGEQPGDWLGWHITRADGPALVTSLLQFDGERGAIELHAFR